MTFKIGDKVRWDGSPNEFRDNRHGTIVGIHKGIAKIDDMRSSERFRLVPIKILQKDE